MAGLRQASTLGQWLKQSTMSLVSNQWAPDFIIIGAQKAGTTSLYDYLSYHPLVMRARTKEVHYFDLNYHRGWSWYCAQFPSQVTLKSRLPFSSPDNGGFGRPITGEATPYYMYHPLAPQRIYTDARSAKLIAILRNPIDRAYSHYHHNVRKQQESLSFEEAIDHEAERLVGEEQLMRESDAYHGLAHQRYSYLARGRYVEQLDRWFEFVGRDQFLILHSETLFEQPVAACNEVLEFLELPQANLDTGSVLNSGSYSRMPPELRRRLAEYFAPHNQRLYELLGTTFPWDD